MKTVSDNADAQVLGFGSAIPDGLQFPFALDMRKYDKVCLLVSLSEAGIPPNRAKVQLFESTGLGEPETLVKETAVIDVDGVQPEDPINVIVEANAENLSKGKTHFTIIVDVISGAINIGAAALAFAPHHKFQNLAEKDVVLKAWE